MSKFLNVPNGNYKISVESGGEITLNTGVSTGLVRVTGDLLVEGNTTTVNTANLEIEDNIIVLNKGENNPTGISELTAGIQIDRGGQDDALILFDETQSWQPPVGGLQQGLFTFKDASGAFVAIQTNTINTGGGDLNLINSGTGVISVIGTNNYENQVTDDDHITNKKYVDDYVSTFFTTNFQTRIDDGTATPSYVEVIDSETSGNPSVVVIGIDNSPVARFETNTIELNDIRITGTQIESFNTGDDLILGAPSTGSVRINDSLIINSTPTPDDASIDPAFPSDGVKLYVKPRAEGGTGLYFVNQDSTRDEIISRNRSLVFSMLF